MRATVRYLIRGKPKLRELAQASDDFSVLASPFLVESQEGGAHSTTLRREYQLRAKIFVLLHFLKEYSSIPEVGVFLRSAAPAEHFFDEWWELIQAEDEEHLPIFGETFHAENVARSQIPPTGSQAVEEWLDRVVAF